MGVLYGVLSVEDDVYHVLCGFGALSVISTMCSGTCEVWPEGLAPI
jgi:hypothetical protein